MQRLYNLHHAKQNSADRWQWRRRLLRGTPLILLLSILLNSVLLVSANVMPGYAQDDPNAVPDNALFNAAIAAPVHQSPATDSVSTALTDPPVGVPTLTWATVAGATDYNVQISASEGFATTVVNDKTEATTYTPKIVLADGAYFWRVRAEVDNAWGNFSEPWSFHKDWSAGGQVKPLLLAPADDPSGLQPITTFTPDQFSWEPVAGAAAYNLEISASPSFNDAKPYRVTTLKTRHTPTTQFANNQYYWRVTPVDSRDHLGASSDVHTFTFSWNQIPALLAPDPQIDARFVPRFSWSAVAGASAYNLQISSSADFADFVANITTKNTSYTPDVAPANNKDYFWRVRAISPQAVSGPTSEVRSFHTNWIQPPTLLSPPVRSIWHIYPFFSWTPVAGAERYQIQIALGNGFDHTVQDIILFNATSYTQPEWDEIQYNTDYIWRVRAIDAQDNTTNWSSEQTFRFLASPPPNLVYPEPYYAPDAEGMPVHSDRTIAHPIFVWDTTHEYLGGNGPAAFFYPDYYRLEVATDRAFTADQIVFKNESAGPGAAPTLENPFNNLTDGVNYYWRVTPIANGLPMAEGTIWETRIDRNVPQLPLDNDSVPDISHPQDGFISVDSAPIFGWLPVINAHHYEVQVSTNREFTAIVDSANALFAYYVPWQGRHSAMPSDTYWWRVRAKDGDDAPLGDWTLSRHFLVMHNLMTGNVYDYALPAAGTLVSDTVDAPLYKASLSMVASDTMTVAAPYNVGELHVVQDRSLSLGNRNWVIAFGADNGVTGSLTYALYFDVNQKENVGGAADPRGKPIQFDPLYLPDYIIYLDRTDDQIVNATFYEWTGIRWSATPLGSMGGTYFYDLTTHAVQVSFPYSAIILTNSDQFSGGLALTVYSTGSTNEAGPVDSAPQQGTLTLMDQPALFSNIPVPLYPFDTPFSDPIVFHELPALRWRMPGYNSIDGYMIQVARNPNFTQDNIIETWESYESKTSSYYGGIPTAFHSGKSYNDEESYYWRIRYRHEYNDKRNDYDVSPWSQPMRFKLTSYQPGNPAVTVGNPDTGQAANTTPSFTWERVEGAARYTIQIDNDFNMNSPITNKTIDGDSFTDLTTLEDGTYYWRVAMRRSDNVIGQWTAIMSFTKTSLTPVLVGPINNATVNAQPTFEWAATVTNTGELHVAASRYRLQWDDNPQFDSPVSVETEATSYTPVEGQSLTDGTWYWRVAMIDGNNKRGPDSAVATFYKEYLKPETISPVQGSSATQYITFEWSPLDGAAYYKLEIDDNEAFDSPIRVSTDNTRYTHIASFEPGEYYWRVQMVDKDGKPGPTIPGRFSQGPDGPGDGPALFMPFVSN